LVDSFEVVLHAHTSDALIASAHRGAKILAKPRTPEAVRVKSVRST
jgi:hypothetical protein